MPIYNQLQNELDNLSEASDVRVYSEVLDGRYEIYSQDELDAYYAVKDEHFKGQATIHGIYFLNASLTIPDSFWKRDARYVYLYYMDWLAGDGTSNSLPEIPEGADNFERLQFNLRRLAGNSMGTAGINDVPTSWRNAKGVFRLAFERQELSSEQQVGIINGLSREIEAGMSEQYVSTSTTTRIIDFQNTSTQANDPLDQTELPDWLLVSPNEMEKFITNPSNGTTYRWRLLHN